MSSNTGPVLNVIEERELVRKGSDKSLLFASTQWRRIRSGLTEHEADVLLKSFAKEAFIRRKRHVYSCDPDTYPCTEACLEGEAGVQKEAAQYGIKVLQAFLDSADPRCRMTFTDAEKELFRANGQEPVDFMPRESYRIRTEQEYTAEHGALVSYSPVSPNEDSFEPVSPSYSPTSPGAVDPTASYDSDAPEYISESEPEQEEEEEEQQQKAKRPRDQEKEESEPEEPEAKRQRVVDTLEKEKEDEEDEEMKDEKKGAIFFRSDVRGPYLFLSNSWPDVVPGGKQEVFDAHPGVLARDADYSFQIGSNLYRTAEQAFHAMCYDAEGKPLASQQIRAAKSTTPAYIQRIMKRLEYHSSTHAKQIDVMRTVLRAKFNPKTNPGLVQALLATGDRDLHETRGRSPLLWVYNPDTTPSLKMSGMQGKLLMQVRSELKACTAAASS